jgi:hypothetical protein
MRTTADCKMDEGFLNYLTFLFCIIGGKLLALGLTLLVSIETKYSNHNLMSSQAGWLLVLFVGLGVTADA